MATSIIASQPGALGTDTIHLNIDGKASDKLIVDPGGHRPCKSLRQVWSTLPSKKVLTIIAVVIVFAFWVFLEPEDPCGRRGGCFRGLF